MMKKTSSSKYGLVPAEMNRVCSRQELFHYMPVMRKRLGWRLLFFIPIRLKSAVSKEAVFKITRGQSEYPVYSKLKYESVSIPGSSVSRKPKRLAVSTHRPSDRSTPASRRSRHQHQSLAMSASRSVPVRVGGRSIRPAECRSSHPYSDRARRFCQDQKIQIKSWNQKVPVLAFQLGRDGTKNSVMREARSVPEMERKIRTPISADVSQSSVSSPGVLISQGA